MKTDKIEKGVYEGYVWMSDENTPVTILDEEYESDLNPSTNPFIIEAQLYDKKNEVSYSVKYIDGQYVAHKWEAVSEEMKTKIDYSLHTFLPNRVGMDKDTNISSLKFLQHWTEEDDDNLCGMKVLRPSELIFIGFEK